MSRPVNKPLLIIFIAVAGLAISFELQPPPNEGVSDNPNQKPDHYFTHFNFYSLSPEGKPAWKMEGKHLYHQPLEEISRFTETTITHRSPKGAPWVINAPSGEMPDTQTHLLLPNKVSISRNSSELNKALQLYTHELYYYPDTRLLTTRHPVTMTSEEHTTFGNGLVGHLDKEIFEIVADVKATYHASPRGK